jgi:hypothetical protein
MNWGGVHRKEQVRDETRRAIAAGVIKRPTRCEACRSTVDVHAHHPDYDQPLFVIGLCASCHARVHAGQIREPRTGRWYETTAAPAAGFGAWLRERRQTLGLGLRPFAAALSKHMPPKRRASITYAAVSCWETGAYYPERPTLLALLEMLDVRGDERVRVFCLYFDGENPRASSSEAA